ncbi:MAG: hypothetical protein ACRDWI_15590 [Jiangellaceae bacterium]
MTTRSIGPAGTAARVAVGLLLIGGALMLDYPSDGITRWDITAALVVLPLIALATASVLDVAYRRHPALARRARTPWSASQSVAALVVICAVIGLGTVLTFLSPVDRIALFLFFGLSMLLAAARGYDGCEILAIPNAVLRRADSIWCPVYSPIDATGQPAADAADRRQVSARRVPGQTRSHRGQHPLRGRQIQPACTHSASSLRRTHHVVAVDQHRRRRARPDRLHDRNSGAEAG